MKRFFDIVVSALGLICLSPLFLLLVILISLDSPGPAIYKSYRIGRNGKRFSFYKFRSMREDTDRLQGDLQKDNSYLDIYVDPEDLHLDPTLKQTHLYGDTYGVNEFDYLNESARRVNSIFLLKIDNDPRITRVGRFIRRASLDELPQLWSVLKGDMSLVGNRPLVEEEAERLTGDVYGKRFDCAAGITGLWQSRKGKDTMRADRRRALDVYYAKHQSLWLDFQIIVATFMKVLAKGNE